MYNISKKNIIFHFAEPIRIKLKLNAGRIIKNLMQKLVYSDYSYFHLIKCLAFTGSPMKTLLRSESDKIILSLPIVSETNLKGLFYR